MVDPEAEASLEVVLKGVEANNIKFEKKTLTEKTKEFYDEFDMGISSEVFIQEFKKDGQLAEYILNKLSNIISETKPFFEELHHSME